MTFRDRPCRSVGLFIRLVAAMVLMATSSSTVASATFASSQSGTSNVAIVTLDNGVPFLDACFELVGYSNEGCDVNRDGDITFEAIPHGSYTLRQTRSLPGNLYVPDTTITVTGAADADGWERFYVSVVDGGPAQPAASNVAIVPTHNGQPFLDACFVLVDYSNEGCDQNRDGKITFEAIPHGTYTLRQTRSLAGGLFVNDTTIHVTGAADADGWERFYVSVLVSAPTAGGADSPVDISLITRDPESGSLITDVCYVLVDYSNEGCDENNDGQVTFDDIPPGTYTVRQTQAPVGFTTINNFEIEVVNVENLSLGFLVRQAPEQNSPDSRNVSIVFVDVATKKRVVSDICVELVGASNVGCDEDLRDGQIDFLDVPAGSWRLQFSNVPASYQVIPDATHSPYIAFDATPQTPSHVMYFVDVSTTGGNSNQGSSVSQGSQDGPMGITAAGPGGYLDGAKFTVTSQRGEFIGSCTLIDSGDPIVQACYVNVPRDAIVTVTLDTSSIPADQIPEENPIQFDTGSPALASFWGVGFKTTSSGGAGGASDIAIVTTINGQPFYDACFVLLDYSNEGCDVNRDGKITFEDIPVGTYTLRQTVDLGGGLHVSDITITVTNSPDNDGWERFYVSVSGT